MRKVVFLSCHPNMWEGFETIWEKEISNPDSDVRVIPVPTYSRGHDDSLYDAEYITTGYPSDVEITDINSYDLEANHPDTIYVQNIEDTSNPGFAVHPHFHTSNIRAFCNELIYIPYNCMAGINPADPDLDKYFSRLLIPNGIGNVDKIIVHSENMKNVYLNLIAGHNEIQRQEWDKKISYVEYPRTCILKKYSKETVPYPEKWNRHLFDAEGNRKKTVLFATSVFGVLEYNRTHFRKIRETLEQYLSEKDRTTLIWRPHKNLPEVIIKLRPELFDDFRTLLEFYISNDIGIFDETPTPTPAIVLSDAYIGDTCGVKELFMSTNKPVLEWTSSVDKYMLL